MEPCILAILTIIPFGKNKRNDKILVVEYATKKNNQFAIKNIIKIIHPLLLLFRICTEDLVKKYKINKINWMKDKFHSF